MALVLDTGPLYAFLDRHDVQHEASQDLIGRSAELLIVPSPVLVEVDYLLTRFRRSDVFLLLLRDIQEGRFRVEDLQARDYQRAFEILTRYADFDIGFVDAAVLAVVERLGEPKLATLDRRHFSALRPRHVESLQLLP